MQFEKRMVILTGAGKGTLKVERNGYGTWATLATYGITATLTLTVLDDTACYEYEVNAGGIKLDDGIDVGNAHFLVYGGEEVVLYGTLSAARMSEHELRLRRRTLAKTDVCKKADAPPQESVRLTDIFPSGEEYADDAVTAVNYYGGKVMNEHEHTSFVRDALKSDIAFDDEPIARKSEFEPAEKSEPTAPISPVLPTPVAFNEPVSPQPPPGLGEPTAPRVFKRRLLKKKKEERAIPPPETPSVISGRTLTYYERVCDDIEKLFSTLPRESELEKLLPSTRWVRCDYGGSRYYVVGLIGTKPDYVCYGIPGEYSPTPPAALEDRACWLPLNVRAPEGKGYWVLYQDAATGKSVKPQ